MTVPITILMGKVWADSANAESYSLFKPVGANGPKANPLLIPILSLAGWVGCPVACGPILTAPSP